MRLAGTLCHWNDARGFGFIAGPDGARYFVHIKSIGGVAPRPRHGDAVTFLPADGRDGKLEARSVEIALAGPAVPDNKRQVDLARLSWRLVAAGIIVATLAIAIAMGYAPLWLAGLYAVMGAASFLLYRSDKAAATAGNWRTSEVTLLALDICFGVVGGLLAQHIYRHKTRKAAYITTSMLLTVVHTVWLTALANGLITTGDVAGLLHPLIAAWS